MEEFKLDNDNIYDQVYVVNKTEKKMVGLGKFVTSSKYDFEVIVDGERKTFSNYSHDLFCVEAVKSNVEREFVKSELKLLSFLYRTSLDLSQESHDELLAAIETIKRIIADDLSKARSLLRSTAGYPKGDDEESIKQSLLLKVLGVR